MKMLRIFDILDHLKEYGNKDILARREADGKWKKYTIEEYVEHAYAISSALLELGVKKGDKVATIMQNRPEWNFLDMGIAMAGGIHVPVYPTLNENDYRYILNHCDTKLIVIGVEQIYKRVEPAIPDLTLQPEIFTIAKIEGRRSFDDLLEIGRANIEKWRPVIEEIKQNTSPEDIGTLIYTSGTTGKPKGVMLRHKSMVINAAKVASMNTHDYHACVLSFLPLCHVYERVCNYMYQILGGTIYYAGSLATIGKDLKDIHAMGFCAVPRVLEMMFDKLQAAGKDLKGLKRVIYSWAFRIAQVYDNERTGWFYKTKYRIADYLVYSKWREQMGGNPMIIVSGGSSIQERIIRTFTAANMYVFEGYGLTETSPVISVNNPARKELHPGTVGPVLDCIDFKLAEDGEILTKGDCLMVGYYKDEESTRAAIDEEGWFHTGDIGTLVDGFLKITDRKKEIFKLSTGKYVAPQVLENRLKESFFIEQAMVIGENEKIAAAILVPNFDTLHFWCAKHKIHYSSNEELCTNTEVIKRIQREITKLNDTLAEHEQIRKFRLVADTWSPQTGELSQTLKLRRAALYKKYDALCREIYQYEQKEKAAEEALHA
ncbi:MAG: long-chain fatty acid--CoA ligase [Bacteroidales bacterium]|nr:long-chain fatty acid--CoA ligase [Bacteroidales bacterium]